MQDFFFVSDLHGLKERYRKLFEKIISELPSVVFMGGDLLPHQHFSQNAYQAHAEFIENFFIPQFTELKKSLRNTYPRIFLILGNDDSKLAERPLITGGQKELWYYIHKKYFRFNNLIVLGYACVPPTPFLLKDWEKYDVSCYVDPGCIPPEEGYHSVPESLDEKKFDSIKKDLENLSIEKNKHQLICLFHSPPYQTKLDRAALDDQYIDQVPLNPHIGSIAIRQFIEQNQPLLTLHGHVHESTRLTGSWRDQIGNTFCFNAAHDGSELALVRFNPQNLQKASRVLL